MLLRSGDSGKAERNNKEDKRRTRVEDGKAQRGDEINYSIIYVNN